MKESLILVSGYGAPGEEDIALYCIAADGKAQKLYGMCHGGSPSFCCQGGNGLIYAASERSDGADITAYKLQGESMRVAGKLTVPGRGLCHLHACGGIIFGSCYDSGDFFAADEALDRVLWHFSRPDAHAHWAYRSEKSLYLADLGNDCLYRFALVDGLPAGDPEVLHQPQGSGPRQILMWKDGNMACVNELDGMLRVLDEDGVCQAAVPASSREDTRCWPGGACLDGDGMLYVCNRGPNTIAAWQLREGQFVKGPEWAVGDWPRHIAALSGTGHVAAACMRGNEVRGYALGTGMPVEEFRLPLAGASCVLEL